MLRKYGERNSGCAHVLLSGEPDSAYDRRIPVQMKSRVVVGSITATISGGGYWPGKKQLPLQ
jgi:hypothetical protein